MYSEEPCRQCGENRNIQNKAKHLCGDCVFRNNHEGKSKVQVYKERKYKKLKEKKVTGEKGLFLEIWKERPHYCENCGKPLGNNPKPHFFSHIRSKGAAPELRLNKSNIELLCKKCHYIWDFGDREEFKKRKDKYR